MGSSNDNDQKPTFHQSSEEVTLDRNNGNGELEIQSGLKPKVAPKSRNKSLQKPIKSLNDAQSTDDNEKEQQKQTKEILSIHMNDQSQAIGKFNARPEIEPKPTKTPLQTSTQSSHGAQPAGDTEESQHPSPEEKQRVHNIQTEFQSTQEYKRQVPKQSHDVKPATNRTIDLHQSTDSEAFEKNRGQPILQQGLDSSVTADIQITAVSTKANNLDQPNTMTFAGKLQATEKSIEAREKPKIKPKPNKRLYHEESQQYQAVKSDAVKNVSDLEERQYQPNEKSKNVITGHQIHTDSNENTISNVQGTAHSNNKGNQLSVTQKTLEGKVHKNEELSKCKEKPEIKPKPSTKFPKTTAKSTEPTKPINDLETVKHRSTEETSVYQHQTPTQSEKHTLIGTGRNMTNQLQPTKGEGRDKGKSKHDLSTVSELVPLQKADPSNTVGILQPQAGTTHKERSNMSLMPTQSSEKPVIKPKPRIKPRDKSAVSTSASTQPRNDKKISQHQPTEEISSENKTESEIQQKEELNEPSQTPTNSEANKPISNEPVFSLQPKDGLGIGKLILQWQNTEILSTHKANSNIIKHGSQQTEETTFESQIQTPGKQAKLTDYKKMQFLQGSSKQTQSPCTKNTSTSERQDQPVQGSSSSANIIEIDIKRAEELPVTEDSNKAVSRPGIKEETLAMKNQDTSVEKKEKPKLKPKPCRRLLNTPTSTQVARIPSF
ncbi:nucleolar protein dao-5-like [Ptychodera flava]|uniref:nucleolar protein dao-5-like n=1 Tax=Ptychodera flava TaxID=63121 RepID=UPI00396A054D